MTRTELYSESMKIIWKSYNAAPITRKNDLDSRELMVIEEGGVDIPILVKDIMQKFANDMRSIFGDSLSRVIVYGSYARGDYTELSDVDVMILVKI